MYNAAEILGVDVLDIISGDAPKLSMCCMVKKGKGYSVKRGHEYDYKHLAYTFRGKKGEPFLVTITPDMYNDLTVKRGLFFGSITLDTIDEDVVLSNIDPNALPEIETVISEYMMSKKREYEIKK